MWLPRFEVSFDAAPFRVWIARTIAFWGIGLMSGNLINALRTVVFRWVVDGSVISFDAYVWNFESPVRGFSIDQGGASDDREVFTEYRRYANKWLSTHRGTFGTLILKAKGLHLIFVEGRSQFGLTYTSRLGWERRYAVTIGGGQGEIGFVFAATDFHEFQMSRFCQASLFFDQIVKSARLRTPSRLQEILTAAPALIGKTALCAGVAWWALRVWGEGGPLRLKLLLAFFFGYCFADLAQWCTRWTYRELLKTIEPALWDVLAPANPFRLLVGAAFHVLCPVLVQWLWLMLGTLMALGQLLVPLLTILWILFGAKADSMPEWIRNNQHMILAATAFVVGSLANFHSVRFMIRRYVKRGSESFDDMEV